MTTFKLDEFLPYRLSTAASRISQEFAAIYREKFGLSVAEWRVIAHLSQTDDAVSVREICSRVELEKSKVSRAATRLEKRGLIRKETNSDDRRLLVLSLTGEGRRLLDQIVPLANAFAETLEERLGAQKDAFSCGLDTVSEPKK